MARYRYRALSADGKVLEGEMEGTDESQVLTRLQEHGHYPVRARRLSGRGSRASLLDRRRRHAVRLDIVTRELARLSAAGVPLERGLEILIDIADNRETARLLGGVLSALRSGQSLADALQQVGPPFDSLYIGMVQAGEAGGTLPQVLAQLSDYLTRIRELKANVTAAMIYPAILLLVSLASLILLLTYVVPQFEDLFSGAQTALPWSTQIVFALAHWLAEAWWLPLFVLLGSLLLLQWLYQMPRSRRWLDRLVLSLPIVGGLVTRLQTARMCRTLGALLRGGVPLLNALTIAENVLTNAVMQQALHAAPSSLKSGSRLAATLRDSQVFPALAVHMIQVGEETGSLDTMLDDIAELYDEEVRQQLRRLLALLEPILILGLGALVGAIIVSILAAILGLNQLAF